MSKMKHASDEIKAAAVSSTTAVSPATVVSPATAVSSTTLQDLPVEVLDYILMKAVVQKVMDKKLAKSAWIGYAFRVIKPLRTVSSQWNCRLTTRWFEIVLHRNLNCIDPTPITVDLVDCSGCDFCFGGFGRLNNKIYCIESLHASCESDAEAPDAQYETESDAIPPDASLHVFEGQDATLCVQIIPLPLVKELGGMATCKRSNSIYIWQTYPSNSWRTSTSVWRVVPDGNGDFEVLQWPTYPPSSYLLDCSTICEITVQNLSVLDDGNLVALRRVYHKADDVVDEGDNFLSVHKPDGLVIRNVKLSHHVGLSNIAMKSDGNFVYAQEICDDDGRVCIIREIDQDGKEIGSFHWLHGCAFGKQLFVGAYDRVILHDGYHSLVFLDSELNILKEVDTLENVMCNFNQNALLHGVFDKETNEMVVMYFTGEVLFLKLSL